MYCSAILMIILSIIIMIAGTKLGKHKYNSYFTPLTFELVWSFGVFQLLSAILALLTRDQLSLNYNEEAYIKTLAISFVGSITYLVIYYIFKSKKIVNVIIAMLAINNLCNKNNSRTGNIFFIIGILSFSYLVFGTTGGMLWVNDSRLAYIEYRTGFGQYYAMYLWAINISFIYILFKITDKKNITSKDYIKVIILYLFILYFSGSKGAMITPFVITLLFYDFYIQTFSFYRLLTFGVLVTFFIIIILLQQTNGINGILLYLSEYFNMTAEYIYRSDELGNLMGLGLLTDFYSMVPRSIYEEKPYIYGVLYIHNLLTPGQAETGNTFGVLQWSLSYLDFGIIGVIFFYSFKAIIGKIIYEIWRVRPTIIMFIICITFVLWSPFPFANSFVSSIIIATIYTIEKVRFK